MTKLHQIIAIERGVVADAERDLGKIRQVIAVGGDRDPLTGLSRTYESRRGEEGDQLPAEYRKVQITVPELVEMAGQKLTRMFDIKFTREFANTQARGTVTVDGQALLEDVPAGYLLFLETQITALITQLIDKLPVLPPAEDWSDEDPALPDGVWASAPRKSERTRKVPKYQVMVDPTPEHRAEIRQWDADEIEGYWTMVRYSGQLPEKQVQAMRARAVKLLEAVKFAREAANEMDVTDREAGAAVLGYVLGTNGTAP